MQPYEASPLTFAGWYILRVGSYPSGLKLQLKFQALGEFIDNLTFTDRFFP